MWEQEGKRVEGVEGEEEVWKEAEGVEEQIEEKSAPQLLNPPERAVQGVAGERFAELFRREQEQNSIQLQLPRRRHLRITPAAAPSEKEKEGVSLPLDLPQKANQAASCLFHLPSREAAEEKQEAKEWMAAPPPPPPPPPLPSFRAPPPPPPLLVSLRQPGATLETSLAEQLAARKETWRSTEPLVAPPTGYSIPSLPARKGPLEGVRNVAIVEADLQFCRSAAQELEERMKRLEKLSCDHLKLAQGLARDDSVDELEELIRLEEKIEGEREALSTLLFGPDTAASKLPEGEKLSALTTLFLQKNSDRILLLTEELAKVEAEKKERRDSAVRRDSTLRSGAVQPEKSQEQREVARLEKHIRELEQAEQIATLKIREFAFGLQEEAKRVARELSLGKQNVPGDAKQRFQQLRTAKQQEEKQLEQRQKVLSQEREKLKSLMERSKISLERKGSSPHLLVRTPTFRRIQNALFARRQQIEEAD